MMPVLLSIVLAVVVDADPCRIYDGIQHPSQKQVCCCLACASYCGGTHCDKGPGGDTHCCASKISKSHNVCTNATVNASAHLAPCLLPTIPSPPPPVPTPPPKPSPTPSPTPPGSSGAVYDDFRTKNTSLWNFANYSLSTQGNGLTFYIANHSIANANLSNGEGRGLVMNMSNIPCQFGPQLCMGAAMATAHLSTTSAHSYGDFELRMRAPHSTGPNPTICDSGVYGYFTAGYVGHPTWNEMNFGKLPSLTRSRCRLCLLNVCRSHTLCCTIPLLSLCRFSSGP